MAATEAAAQTQAGVTTPPGVCLRRWSTEWCGDVQAVTGLCRAVLVLKVHNTVTSIEDCMVWLSLGLSACTPTAAKLWLTLAATERRLPAACIAQAISL